MTAPARLPSASPAIERDTVALARIPAPTGQEEARLEWLASRLAGSGGERSRDEAGNLVWRFAAGRPELALLAHVDTVFDASVSHDVAERDGWLCGPGVGDNALAVATAIAVVERLPHDLRAPLAVVFTVGEEGLGGLRGARHACGSLRPRQAVALEGHGLDVVYADAVGSVRVALRATAEGGHSWWDRGRPSAVHALVAILAALLADPPAGVALNVGRVSGGEAVNAIARRAEAMLEARSLDHESLAGADARFAGLRAKEGVRLALETLDRRPAGRLDRSHPLLDAVRSVRGRLGLPDRVGEGSTDANAALAQGIPALALGCARGADMHAPSERIERSSIPLGAAQLDGVLRRLLAAGSAAP